MTSHLHRKRTLRHWHTYSVRASWIAMSVSTCAATAVSVVLLMAESQAAPCRYDLLGPLATVAVVALSAAFLSIAASWLTQEDEG